MSDSQFFFTSVEEPEGDCALLAMSMDAMNEKFDFTDGERQGGSGRVGKMIFSAGDDYLAIAVYVMEDKQDECSCEEWLKKILDLNPGSKMVVIVTGVRKMIVMTRGVFRIAQLERNSDENVFPFEIGKQRRLTLVNSAATKILPFKIGKRRRLTIVKSD
eukprot:12160897-Heterocapsa_arctica.AAC.1